MAKIGQPYSSGSWLVKEGSEEDFVSRWTIFVEWSLKNAPGLESGLLIQDSDNSRRFLLLELGTPPKRYRPGVKCLSFRSCSRRGGNCAMRSRFAPTRWPPHRASKRSKAKRINHRLLSH